MRLLVPLALLLAVAACERSNRAPRVAPAAVPPPSLATEPAASEPTVTASDATGVARPARTTAATASRPAARPGSRRPKTSASTDESRWVDVDENDPALSEFQTQQQQRDRELLQRDAAEAARSDAAPAREDPQPAPYREEPFEEELPPDERFPPRDEPLPGDEYYGDDEYDSPPEDDYDPGYDDRSR